MSARIVRPHNPPRFRRWPRSRWPPGRTRFGPHRGTAKKSPAAKQWLPPADLPKREAPPLPLLCAPSALVTSLYPLSSRCCPTRRFYRLFRIGKLRRLWRNLHQQRYCRQLVSMCFWASTTSPAKTVIDPGWPQTVDLPATVGGPALDPHLDKGDRQRPNTCLAVVFVVYAPGAHPATSERPAGD